MTFCIDFSLFASQNFSSQRYKYLKTDPIIMETKGIEKHLKIERWRPGLDIINSKFWRGAELYCFVFSKIFEQNIDTCTLSEEWKVGKGAEIDKPRSKTSPFQLPFFTQTL